uniref:PX domain-containing protein n=1 Tax=Globisporangium ultimum (strain ATCC 200006 / CBS 805.95 / DAOM BR144) TaxID=431595 RepID=K3WEX5_GLOUD
RVDVVDHRLSSVGTDKFVEYKLRLQVIDSDPLYCWKRFSAIRKYRTRMMESSGRAMKSLPAFPSRKLWGNLSEKTILLRKTKLNEF